ncbi:SLBB domain-containing protein [Desulfogranum mediterraneum]|uniref:SLBB domain-containing protein n=1 Tax=Desulfogranum mediterraneum TaxID=160661 RepID=UPI00048EAEA8|nr:polysaccharide biosynthesis/export family protein [Desulfogranum mediterraneum]
MKHALLICILAVFLLLPSGPAAANDYVVSFEDVLDISVYDHPEMTTTVRVDGNGNVVLPLINGVHVEGLSVSKVAETITGLLSGDYIINPQVNVFVKQFREQKASVLGQVVKPGLYELRPRTTLLELISQAGGLTVEAGEGAVVKREARGSGDTAPQEVVVDLDRLVEQGDISLNLQILDGDKIFIDKAGVFYVTGEVRNPNSYKYKDRLTVIKAIAMAGGFSDTASTGSVNIVRKQDGKEKVLNKVDLDELVQPEDVIVVPESFF